MRPVPQPILDAIEKARKKRIEKVKARAAAKQKRVYQGGLSAVCHKCFAWFKTPAERNVHKEASHAA